jgi:hypothetical protein
MRITPIGLVVTMLLSSAAMASAQPPTAPPAATKVLAIGKAGPALDRQKIQELMPQEVRDTVLLYLDGKIEQWFFRQDQTGVVLLLSSHTVDEARTVLGSLTLVKSQMLDFDLIPVGPLTPLRALLAAPKE